MNRSGMILHCQFTPATPIPLLPSAPHRPSGVRAVAVRVVGVVVARVEVPPAHVVDVSVAVVVHAVARDLVGVCPDVVVQVRVRPLRPAVDHRHDERRVAGEGVPRLRPVHVRVRHAERPADVLPGVVQAPLEPEELVVRRRHRVHHVVRLRVGHERHRAQHAQGQVTIDAHLQVLQPGNRPERAHHATRHQVPHHLPVRLRHPLLEPDQQRGGSRGQPRLRLEGEPRLLRRARRRR